MWRSAEKERARGEANLVGEKEKERRKLLKKWRQSK